MNEQNLLRNFTDVFNKLNINSPIFYWQSLTILGCFVFTFILYKLFNRFFRTKINNINPSASLVKKIAICYLVPLFLPIANLLLLVIIAIIFKTLYSNYYLSSIILQLVALFLLIRFLKIYLGNNFITNLATIILVPTLVLSVFDLLPLTTSYLDSFAVKLGAVRISLYTVVKAVFILVAVFWFAGLLMRKSRLLIENNKSIKSSTKGVIGKVVDIVIYFAVFLIILKVFGVDMTTFAVIGGAVGVGIGLGLQKIASNFISGIILLFEKSVEIGDLVELDNGVSGNITHFGGRYTLVEAPDGKEIMVPNEAFIINQVVNLTYSNNRGRIEIRVDISYDSDFKKAQEIMIEAAKEHPRCLRYPGIECYFTEFKESAIGMVLYFWVSNVLEGRLSPKSDVMMTILERFKKNNIKIPVPQRDLRVVPGKAESLFIDNS